MKRISLASICFLVVTCILLQCLPRDQCLAHYGSDSDGSNARPSGGADWATRTPAPAVGDYGELTGSVSRTQTKRVYGAGLWPRVRSLAVSRFPGAEEEQWEGAYARGDLPPSQVGDVLTQRKGRTGRSRVHQRVVVTPEPHSWNHRVTIAKGQAVIPVGFEGSFVESPSLLATPTNLGAPVDLQGQQDMSSHVVNRLPAVAGLPPAERAAAADLQRRFRQGLRLTVDSTFSGESFELTGPVEFLGMGSTGIVFRLSQTKAGAASLPNRVAVAAKITVMRLQRQTGLSASQIKKFQEEMQERIIRDESSMRTALPHVNPETALQHGLLFPHDVGRVSNMPIEVLAGNAYAVYPVVSVSPAFTCDLQQLVGGQDLSLSAKFYLTRQLVKSVAWLHRHGVAHNDLKLENVLISSAGQPVLTDFGFAGAIGTAKRIQFTALYLDPQTAEASVQRQPEVMITAARDSWALGTLLFMLWCRSLPHASPYQASLPDRAYLEFMVTQAKTHRLQPNFVECGDLPAAVRELISGFLQWNHEDRRLPGDVVEAFLEATHNGGGERSRR
ncbi:unnamed protein product [Neospora caninum Liverpool]|uniref:Protein kinase domain-containing protein n=1 Tax=Neospora caninum (strain Liverpool) TaxID=572307 RepID=F0VE06_NEOCL|nr:uncharacterized protein NCLIV_017410 [Neospora caninum Liverpool]CBZ51949.1 unnamed protein product [Neospora caninum Liverpool]CEL65910.1 TPA: hypothetical protein BN1204_017410 [Neospora caninum Liverpool]|eukprot:XP_003881982.1 uncharacterized protein NCLIV_017410 [Neospora caninum Liverpool]